MSGRWRPVAHDHRPGSESCTSGLHAIGRSPLPLPFVSRGPSGGLHVRAVDRKLVRHRSVACDLLEQALPDPARRPAIVDRLRLSIGGRHVAPPALCLQHMQDARDHRPIFDPRLAQMLMRQMRLDHRLCLIKQPKQMPCYDRSFPNPLEAATTTAVASRPSVASRPANTSPASGQKIPAYSKSTRIATPRD